MSNSIKLNLGNIDFDDNFNADNGELWQYQASKSLVKNLFTIGQQARKYSERRKKPNNLQPLSIHDAIFISGDRGAGKTVFLNNAEKIWNKSDESQDMQLHFSSSIDPTLLIDHDNFTNVVVAHLYNEVEVAFNKSPQRCELYQTDFYTKLKQLAGSIGQERDYEDRIGIDRIIKYRSGIQQERYFHDYVEICIRILDTTAIVIPIDDVDMALDRAFEVLDVVRRMLGCPFIIPLISGHDTLYQHMVEKHFIEESISEKSSDDTKDEGHKIANRLMESYLIKVLPTQYRINLSPVASILEALSIQEGADDDITFSRYLTCLKSTYFGLTNGQEKSTDFPFPSCAREIVQLVRLLPPSTLVKCPELYEWESLKTWALSNKHGATYTNAVAAQQLLMSGKDQRVRLSELLPFNPINQSLLDFKWADKNFIKEQEIALTDIVEEESRKTNMFVLRDALTNSVLRSMPPLEMHTRRMTISKNSIKSDKGTNLDLLHLYTYRDYYGFQGSQIHKVFFSRAFEILGSSLLMLNSDLTKDDYIDFWTEQLPKLINSAPFYSIHAINPTKYTSEVETSSRQDVDENEGQEQQDSEVVTGNGFDPTFSESLVDWSMKYSQVCIGLQRESLIPLLHAVFNKVFTQLHLLRATHNKLNDEHLTDSVRRFEYIVVNAFATFLKKSGVVKSNVASAAQLKTIRNHSVFITKEHVFSRNVGDFVDLKTGVAFDTPDQLSCQIIEAIWEHPIFKLNTPKCDELDARWPFVYKKRIVFDGIEDEPTITPVELEVTPENNRRLMSYKPFVQSKGLSGLQELIAYLDAGLVEEFHEDV